MNEISQQQFLFTVTVFLLGNRVLLIRLVSHLSLSGPSVPPYPGPRFSPLLRS